MRSVIGSETRLPVRATWQVLLSYARPYWLALVGGGVLNLATAATGLALPLVVRELIGALATDRTVTGLLALMAALVLTNAAIGAVGSYVLERTGESIVLSARRALVSRLIRLRLSVIERVEPGDLTARVTADTTLLRAVTTQAIISAITGVLTLVATAVMMFLMDPVLLAVTLAVLVLAGALIRVVVPQIGGAARQAQEAVGAMGASLERMFGAFRMVKACGAEQREGQRVCAAADQSWRAGVRAAKWSAIAGSTASLAMQTSFVAVLAVGGARVATGAIDVGTLVAFLLYVFYLMSPVQELVNAIAQYQLGAAAVARIQDAEALPVEVDGLPAQLPSSDSRPVAVTFEDVYFRYRPDLELVHSGVKFSVPPGGMTALVGPSGAGKTTVFSLIERFYESDAGRILIDGTDVREWSVTHLRASIGYVEQDTPVMSGTLRENLLFGAPDTCEADLCAALRTARLEAMVARLPDGLDTQVGHRGMRLSGGERQRVAIARALLRRPRLLLLDEATSQLDAINEAALRETIADAARTTTVLVVAHRLSTVRMADRIVVMDAGAVHAIGSHTELIASSPAYAELAATQFLTATP